MHWADEVAERLIESGREIVISTGITPSGEIHIGNLREMITADAVYRAILERGKSAKFYYVADTADPLRRIYPFLDASYAEHVGKPLCDIPCPCGRHPNYAEHFLEPFLESLSELDISAEALRADELYREGKYAEAVVTALEKRDQVARIIDEETGKRTLPEWSPFVPRCNRCGRITSTIVKGFDAEAGSVEYECKCGDTGTVSVMGGGKLVWRVDWPARWSILKVTYEPFGKDHASRGGSFATGKRISEEVFGFATPDSVIYEWLSLKGMGDMSSSKGNVLSIGQMLEVVPPDILRYLILRRAPRKSIVVDTGQPMLRLIDEYDRAGAQAESKRAFELSAIRKSPPADVPYRHLVSVVQIARDDPDKILTALKRSGYDVMHREEILSRAGYARRWLESFAPEEAKFDLQDTLPEEAKNLSDGQKRALAALSERLSENMSGEEIHQLLYAIKEEFGLEPKEMFEGIYLALLGKPKGPRAGWFLSALETEFLKKRFAEAAG
ncbi:lysine--tRNA ligase [bacterium]|nr:lysine--tRNA ligase [bacterium]